MSYQNVNLREIAQKYKDKLKKIKLCIFDVDGILTDGKVYWAGEEIGFNRQFFIQDGYGMKLLQRAGLKVGIITAGESIGVRKRAEYLELDYLYMGKENKSLALNEILEKEGLKDDEFLYMGDDLFDIPLLERAGFSATVSEASYEVHEASDYITIRTSGNGCVREVIDMLRYAQEIVPAVKI